MPDGELESTCVVNGDAMIWSTESARRYCNILEETIPNPAVDDCSPDATATGYLTYLQSTGDFEDQYRFYMKEQWGERSMFLTHTAVPLCQESIELPSVRALFFLREQEIDENVAYMPAYQWKRLVLQMATRMARRL